MPASRHDRAVLENLGQLYRHDLSEALGLMPNQDGTFNMRRLDAFRAGQNLDHRAWLITAAGKLGGFVMTLPHEDGSMTIDDFFVVRALRRTGVGRDAARQTIAKFPGPWRIGFQRYNPGVERFWTQVAAEFVGDAWTLVDELPPPANRPPDTWLIFKTA